MSITAHIASQLLPPPTAAKAHRRGFTDLAEVIAELANSTLAQPTLGEKPVTRRNRPAWAENDREMVRHFMKFKFMRPLLVSLMYWRMNMRQKEIAQYLGMTPAAVKFLLRRLRLQK